MKKVSRYSIAVLLFVMAASLSTYAENQVQATDGWEIRLMPYFWMPSLNSDGTVSGLSGNVDWSFGDVMDHFDFGAMGRMEAWKGKWGFIFDGLFMNLSADESFQGPSGDSFSLDADGRLGMADFGLAYRLYDQRLGDGGQQRLAFEPYGGLRYVYLRQKIDLDVDIAGVGSAGSTLGKSEDWVEPFVGGRVIWDLNDKWSLNVRGDAGGFGIGSASDLTWQIAGGVDYKLSKNMILNTGYRYLELDYSRGSGSDEFGVDIKAKGPFLGLTITF